MGWSSITEAVEAKHGGNVDSAHGEPGHVCPMDMEMTITKPVSWWVAIRAALEMSVTEAVVDHLEAILQLDIQTARNIAQAHREWVEAFKVVTDRLNEMFPPEDPLPDSETIMAEVDRVLEEHKGKPE
jgi:hypothetical protein